MADAAGGSAPAASSRTDRLILRFLALALILLGPTSLSHAIDRQDGPDERRVFTSPSGLFVLALQLEGRQATARMTTGGEFLWQQLLPHDLGPRIVFVADGGQVVLLDEWINVLSDRAVMVIAPGGEIQAVHSTHDIGRVLGIDRRTLARSARFGPWMGGAPALSISGASVRVPVADRVLVIDVASGDLSAEEGS